MRDGGLNAYAHQTASPVERDPFLAEQSAVDAVAAPAIMCIQFRTMIYKQLKQTADAQTALKKAASATKDSKEKSLAQAALKDIANLK